MDLTPPITLNCLQDSTSSSIIPQISDQTIIEMA